MLTTIQVVWEVIEDQQHPGAWRVESFGSDGECYVTIFYNEDAKQRARDYADWMNAKSTTSIQV